MLARCLQTLKKLAPDHPETKRFDAIFRQAQPGWKQAFALFAFAVLLAGTAFHAVLRKPRAASAAVAMMIAATAVVPELARADDSDAPGARSQETEANGAAAARENKRAGALSKYPIDDANPEASVPTPEQRDRDPLEFGYFLMDLGDKAEAAKAAGNHLQAAKVYRAMAKAVPDVPVAFVKACDAYEKAGDLESATQFCAAALTMKGVTLSDYSHYARVVLAKSGKLSDVDVANLDKVVVHLRDDTKTRAAGLDILCTLGVRLGDAKRLEQCAPTLAEMAPDAPKTAFFQWALALQNRDYREAEDLVKKVRAAAAAGQPSLDAQQLALMDRATFEALPVWRRGLRDWRFGAAVSVVLFAGLGIVVMRRRGGRRGGVSAPQPASPSA